MDKRQDNSDLFNTPEHEHIPTLCEIGKELAYPIHDPASSNIEIITNKLIEYLRRMAE